MMFFVQCRQTCPPVERAAGALAVRLGSCLTEAGVDGGNAGGILAIRCELRVWQPGGGPARHRDAVRAAFLPAPSSAPAPLPRRTLRPVRRLEYDLHIRPDTLNTRHRVWFYFAVRGATRGQKVSSTCTCTCTTRTFACVCTCTCTCTCTCASTTGHFQRHRILEDQVALSGRHGTGGQH